ncbi:MAG: T9SS type A sorting domain-containing protein [Flavobacteriales bacterium]|nr:T9SS type A sorting domain-containing protein [Flavobacteriales bacterium]
MNKKIFLSLIVGCAFINLNAQENNIKKCLTTPLMEQELKANPQYKSIVENYFNGLEEWVKNNPKTNAVITIPVVVHVVHKASHNLGIGTNIPQIQIDDAIRILNEDFRKMNPEFPNPPRNTFLSYAGDTQLEFCLATTDPNGNTTTGVTRTATSKTSFDADDNTDSNAMKRTATDGKDGWDALKYLNIWVCNLTNSGGGQTLGYAYLPGQQSQSWTAWKDGLVVDYSYFGTVGNAANSSQNDGRTATHEIGHYLGLLHTFCEQTDAQGNTICCDNDNTSYGGFVDDTPAQEDIYWGLVSTGTNNNTCNDTQFSNAFTSNVLDMDENFMAYSFTTWMFSHKQINVMDYTMNASTGQGGRASLKTSNGCMITGINELLHNNLISVYPNPTSSMVNFKFAMNIKVKSISIQNVLGEEIFTTTNIQNDIFSLDLSDFPKGIYFSIIDTDKGRSTEKILLSK